MARFVVNPHRQILATGLAAALRKLGVAGCRRVIIGGSFVTTKEKPNDFDGWYEDFGLDSNILDPLFAFKCQRPADCIWGQTIRFTKL